MSRIRSHSADQRSIGRGAGESSGRPFVRSLTPVYIVAWLALTGAVFTQADVRGVHLGQRISVSTAVLRVLGPRLFTVGGPDQVIDHEMLVYVPPPGLALVRAGMPTMILGTVRPFAAAELAREWGWNGNASAHSIVDDRVIIVADAAVSDGTSADVGAIAGRQSSSASRIEDDATLTDVNALGASTDAGLVGRRVYIRNARINAVAAGGGFWVATTHEQLFVRPGDAVHLRREQRVNIRGVVLELPGGMKNRLGDYIAARNEAIYVYANQIRTL
jgi:hypothetical protein